MSSKNQVNEEREALKIHDERPLAHEGMAIRAPARAEPVRLGEGLTIAQGFDAIVASCLRHFELNQNLIVQGRDADALHQARVAIRRLRSALAMFAPVASGRKLTRLTEDLRWLFSELGDARNLDVYLERSLSEDQRGFAEERREDAYDRAGAAITSTKSRLLFLDLHAWMRNGRWRANSSAMDMLDPFVDVRIDRLWTKLSRSRAISHMNDHRRHHLRIRVKKLRYALEFTESLHSRRPRRKRKFGKALKEVQDLLGSLHDIVTAGSMMLLNSWLATEHPSAKRQKQLVRGADRGIARLRKVGPYWRGKKHRRRMTV